MARTLTITTFTHSCLLVEHDNFTVLFDPGDISWNAGFDVSKVEKLDFIAITHEHADHFHIPFVQALASKFPGAVVVSTEVVTTNLHEAIAGINIGETDKLQKFSARHEDLPFRIPGPANTGLHFSGVLTHPGDSHSFTESKAVLAMPMTAPWGSMVGAIDKILELKPQYVVPIHDWHWRPEAISKFYERFKTQLANEGIQFIIPIDGQPVEIEIADSL
jgi:L-ascorbate metabolism protein UlaG (beta-lactamase superfamily)